MQRVLGPIGVLTLWCLSITAVRAQVIVGGPNNEYTFELGMAIDAEGNINFHKLIRNKTVLTQLGLAPYQIDELQSIGDNWVQRDTEAYRDLMQRTNNEPSREEYDAYFEAVRQRVTELEETLNQTLLPHQMQLLRISGIQEYNQSRVEGSLGGSFLTHAKIKDLLDISEDEARRLAANWEEEEAELRRKIAELRHQAMVNTLGELDEQSQRLLHEKFGVEVEPEEEKEETRDRRD